MARKVPRRVKRIGVATTDWSGSIPSSSGGMAMGGAGWVRFGQVARSLKNPVVLGRLAQRSDGRLGIVGWDRQTYFDCDLLFMQRHMEDWVPDAVERACRTGQIIVNDVDDWFWGLHPDNAAHKVVNPHSNKHSNINHYRDTLDASTLVTASTPWLVQQLSSWGVDVRLVQNRVATDSFRPRIHRAGLPVLGWTGSTAHRSGDLEVLAAVTSRLNPKQRWHHTGHYSSYPSFADKIAAHPTSVSVLPMLPPWDYPRGFVFDIGVVPLSEMDFNRAKSFIKGVEYAASGIPFVASPLPEYVRLRDEFGIGRLASTPDEWVRHLKELSDHRIRSEEASRQRQVVVDHLDVRYQADDLNRLIAELTD